MKSILFCALSLLIFKYHLLIQAAPQPAFVPGRMFLLPAEGAQIDSARVEIIPDERLKTGKGCALKAGVETKADDLSLTSDPDLSWEITAPEAGLYVLVSQAVTDDYGADLMKKARSKYQSLFMKIQIDDGRPTRRVVYVPWNRPDQVSGKFRLSGKTQQIKIWLPRGVRLGHLGLTTYKDIVVPEAAQNYQPSVIPPKGHPRLWLNAQSLPLIQERVKQGENKAVWDALVKEAKVPFSIEFTADKEVNEQPKLEAAAEIKAFYSLMTGDTEIGKEAVNLIDRYLSVVEFGNLLDITREIGRAIYTSSLVYDWCYDLMDTPQKQRIRENLMRLARNMECGWPPFKGLITTGHTAEGQINRDLLALSIALWGDDSEPYRYTSYRILEELVPMRKFEYQSPRFNQGVGYGGFRFAWELHAAWLFQRMTDKPVFDENIKDVRYYWQYMRVPDGQMLRDGDGGSSIEPSKLYYWSAPTNTFLNYSYSGDPIIKGEFLRQNGEKWISQNPVLFLLLNDPNLKAESSQDSLPLTKDFGKILGSMVARTGWTSGLDSNDVVAEIKGGGYIFGNHQHSDAGAIQVYYRGFQFGDIGSYGFYGIPYDFNFNKRSVAHSMMLVRDPEESFAPGESNDGGTRFNQRAPKSVKEVTTDPYFRNGEVISTSVGPEAVRPVFSYFDVDLASAYTAKVSSYRRRFCFVNLQNDAVPAAIVLLDDITSAAPDFQKFWQINAYKDPEIGSGKITLHNERGGQVGKTHIRMLIPAESERKLTVMNGDKVNDVFGQQYEPSSAFQGARIMISPKKAKQSDRFLTVFQMAADKSEELPVSLSESAVSYTVLIGNHAVILPKGEGMIVGEFSIALPSGEKPYQVAVAGLSVGQWRIQGKNKKTIREESVAEGKNSIFFEATGGEYQLTFSKAGK